MLGTLEAPGALLHSTVLTCNSSSGNFWDVLCSPHEGVSNLPMVWFGSQRILTGARSEEAAPPERPDNNPAQHKGCFCRGWVDGCTFGIAEVLTPLCQRVLELCSFPTQLSMHVFAVIVVFDLQAGPPVSRPKPAPASKPPDIPVQRIVRAPPIVAAPVRAPPAQAMGLPSIC